MTPNPIDMKTARGRRREIEEQSEETARAYARREQELVAELEEVRENHAFWDRISRAAAESPATAKVLPMPHRPDQAEQVAVG